MDNKAQYRCYDELLT